jgi:hypothetical protein
VEEEDYEEAEEVSGEGAQLTELAMQMQPNRALLHGDQLRVNLLQAKLL